MTRHWNSIVRKMAPALSAGFLLQANGCAIDTNALAEGVLTAVVNNVISSLVFGIFNVPLTGF